MAGAIAVACMLLCAPEARADLFGTVTYTEPSETLVMPFDNTRNRVSFQIVSRTASADPVIATHWSYWAHDCGHLADVFICLTERDTVVVDPANLRAQFQDETGSVIQGPLVDLTGHEGVVIVTAFSASPDSIDRRACQPGVPLTTLADQIVGAWTIASQATSAAFGSDAIGLSTASFVGDEASSFLGGSSACVPFSIQTYNPAALTDSSVILIPVQFDTGEFGAGHGEFKTHEIGPIATPGSPKICCAARFVDSLEVATSLPDVCFDCVDFAPIVGGIGNEAEASIIPPTTAVSNSGMVQMCNCTVTDPAEGTRVPIAESSVSQFVLGFHGQAIGTFGTVTTVQYTGGLSID